MKLYLDVSCLNRPWDDQTQPRIRLESEAVTLIFQRLDEQAWQQVSSQMAEIEINAMTDRERRKRVRALLPDPRARIILTDEIFHRAKEIVDLGFAPADATHIAAAEASGASILLSCDDRLVRRAKRLAQQIRLPVENPVDWLQEMNDAQNT